MRKAFDITCWLFFLGGLSSCKVIEQKIPGTYRMKQAPKTRLVLHSDKTFSFAKILTQPGLSVFHDTTDRNFRCNGIWELRKNKIYLTSHADSSLVQEGYTRDEIQEHASITSFSFWDQHGGPITIRFIKFFPNRVKLHLNNSISFFAEDFSPKDTLEFHFFGYPPYKWPDNRLINDHSNSVHSIVLLEEARPDFFKDQPLRVGRSVLKEPGAGSRFRRIKKFRIQP